MRRDRGAAEVLGLVLITPAMLGLASLVLWLGREVDTSAQVRAASEAAAQAAARQRDPQSAREAATATAALMLDDIAGCAATAQVLVDTSAWRPGGVVTVTVSCSPSTADLRPAAPGRSPTFTGVASATLDTFRAGALP